MTDLRRGDDGKGIARKRQIACNEGIAKIKWGECHNPISTFNEGMEVSFVLSKEAWGMWDGWNNYMLKVVSRSLR